MPTNEDKPKRRQSQNTIEKRERFVSEYIKDYNATKAAIRAGYAESAAHNTGWELTRDPVVVKMLEAEKKRIFSKNENIKEQIINQLRLLAFSDLSDYGTFGQCGYELKPSEAWPKGASAAISQFDMHETSNGVSAKIKLASKEKALELLMRHFGMLQDKLEVTVAEPRIVRRFNSNEVIEMTQVPKKEISDGSRATDKTKSETADA